MKQEIIALNLVDMYHAGQKYGDAPYWHHLQDVAVSVAKAGGDDAQLAIAWLHDCLEDTACTGVVLLENGISMRVVSAVVAMSKVEGESYEDYIKKVRSNPDASFVKKHDTLCNLTQSLREGNSKRIKKYAKQLLLLEE